MTRAPGIIVNTPAAANVPYSRPIAEEVRVIATPKVLTSVPVKTLDSKSSTQENMKQKNAVTPMPEEISGRKIFRKKAKKE